MFFIRHFSPESESARCGSFCQDVTDPTWPCRSCYPWVPFRLVLQKHIISVTKTREWFYLLESGLSFGELSFVRMVNLLKSGLPS